MNKVDSVRNWGLMLVFVSAGCMIYYFLLPSGSVSKTAKTVLSAVVMGIICMPVFEVIISADDFSFDFSAAPAPQSFNELLTESAEEAVNSVISQTVKKYTDIEYKTEITIDISEDQYINISSVNIIFSVRPAHERDIRQELYEKLGIMPDIFTERVNE